jgi:hypothetical protein
MERLVLEGSLAAKLTDDRLAMLLKYVGGAIQVERS